MRTIKPVPSFKKEEIKLLRLKLGYTQAVFAKVVGVSVKAVEAWENGRNQPVDSTCRLLQILNGKQEVVEQLLFCE